MTRRTWWIVGIAAAVVALGVALAWPPADPFARANTVALRSPHDPTGSDLDVDAELRFVLNERDLRIVPDERTADVVVDVTDARFDLGSAQIALSGGKLVGRATAVCRIVNARTGRAYVMDLVLSLQDGKVTARLVGRRFWEFWKPQPTLAARAV